MERLVIYNGSRSALGLEEHSVIYESGRTSQTIPISQIISFEIKEPGSFSGGKITIKLGGASGSHLAITSFFAVSSTNNIEFYFQPKDLSTANKMQQYIQDYQAKLAAPQTVIQGHKADPVDEIRRYKGLCDDGIITTEEFEAKKKQLLGL